MTPELVTVPARSAMWMRRSAVGLLVALLLILPCASAIDPLLYTARNGSVTGFHQDLVATGDLSRTDAALLLEEWETSLNLTGPLVRDIRLRDRKAANNSLQRSLESSDTFKDLVIRLDIIDTDVASFLDNNLLNARALRKLLDQVTEFDDLVNGEARYTEQRNISGLKSVELRGEDLRTKIRDNYNGYADRSRQIIRVSRNFGLDTSSIESSVRDFGALVAEIDAVQDARSLSIRNVLQGLSRVAFPSRMEIDPDQGSYGDTLSMAGTVSGVTAGTMVTIFVDGQPAGQAATDRQGRFSFPYTIGELDAGAHSAYAAVEFDVSESSTFTAYRKDSTLSLAVHSVEESGVTKCIGTGRLATEDGVPVEGARISMSVDGRAAWDAGITGDDGEYTIIGEELSPESHTLKVRFDPDGFPLNGSESDPVTIEIPPHFSWVNALIYLLGIGGAAVGGVLFLRNRHLHNGQSPVGVEVVDVEPPAPQARSAYICTVDEARMLADQLIVIDQNRVDGHATIAQTYPRLVQELEAKNPGLRLRSRTPRSLAALFADQSYGESLAVLVGIHERVRYAANDPTEEDLLRMREAFITVMTEGTQH